MPRAGCPLGGGSLGPAPVPQPPWCCKPRPLTTPSPPAHSLNWCDLDETACGFLTCVLRFCTSLTHLSLSANPLGDGSVHLLCQALENPTCHLQELE